MKNYVQPGNAIRLIAPAGGVVSGRPYAIGGITGIATETEIEGGSFELAREGVYAVEKDASEFAPGDAVYALNRAATSDTAGEFLGYATTTAGTGDETVSVLLVTKAAGGSASVAAYTEFKAAWSQSGTAAPVLGEILTNTIGYDPGDGEFGLSYFGPGSYNLHYPAGPYTPATLGKCEIEIFAQSSDATPLPRTVSYAVTPAGDGINFNVFDSTGTACNDHGHLVSIPCFITIRYWA